MVLYLIQGAFMRDIKFGLEGIVLSYILFGVRWLLVIEVLGHIFYY